MIRDFFLGFIKIHILYHAARGPVYGLDLIRELARHGYNLSPGTLYPVLHSLERSGYLNVDRQVVNGKVRKYYTATERGKAALSEAYAKARELMDEISHDDGNPITELT
jgi:PadR family transcriptional regulator PadR